MNDSSADLDQADEDILGHQLSDEALEAAAGMDGLATASLDKGGGISLVAVPFCC